MEGHALLRMQREILDETSSSGFLNERTSYDYFYSAVQDFNFRTHYITNVQTLNISPNIAEYNLSPDFVSLSLMDSFNRYFINHTYSGNTTSIYSRDYASVVLENSTTTAPVAESFSITDSAQISNVTGTSTATSASLNGECTLSDTNTTPFGNVFPGDFVHNTTKGTDGIVISAISSSQVKTALFTDGAPDAGWSINDDYVIVLQPRYKLVVSPIPSDVSTISVPYIVRPNPVYSLYASYKLPFQYILPIVKFSAFLYKYKDREPNYGDAFFKFYDGFVKRIAAEMRRGIPERQGMRVNFSKVNARSRSLGNWNR